MRRLVPRGVKNARTLGREVPDEQRDDRNPEHGTRLDSEGCVHEVAGEVDEQESDAEPITPALAVKEAEG